MDGLNTKIHQHNDGEGTITFETYQNCDAIAERAKAMHNAGITGSKDMKLAATIPEVFVTKYCNDKNITFGEFLKNKEHVRAMLQDPALAHFRVWKGAI
jgi:hypothetical protein